MCSSDLQALAFALFRFFDAVKPGPVGWADRAFKLRAGETIGWRQGFGILFDDLVAAGCTLLVLALWRFVAWARPNSNRGSARTRLAPRSRRHCSNGNG